uniref:Uncharacterized protein n=1 Tax=Anguilla anguilla TaxID=7936 RepID=A0A0E9TGD4_ANGAN
MYVYYHFSALSMSIKIKNTARWLFGHTALRYFCTCDVFQHFAC